MRNNTPDPLEDKFRDRFSGFRPEPKEGLFTQIQAQMQTEASKPSRFWGIDRSMLNKIILGSLNLMLVFLLFKGSAPGFLETHSDQFPPVAASSSVHIFKPKQDKKGFVQSEKPIYPSIPPNEEKKTSAFLTPNQQNLSLGNPDKEPSYTQTSFETPINSISRIPSLGLICKPDTPIVRFEEGLYLKNITPKKTSEEGFRFFFSVTPLMNYYHFRLNQGSNYSVQHPDAGNLFSSQRLGWRISLGSFFKLNSRLSMRLGLNYAQYQQNFQYIVVDSSNNQPINQIYKQNLFNQTVGFQSDALYTLNPGRLYKSYLVTGFNLNIPINSHNFPTQIGWQMAYQASFPINKNLELWLEPSLNIPLNPYKDNFNLVKVRPFTLGLSFGLKFQIKN